MFFKQDLIETHCASLKPLQYKVRTGDFAIDNPIRGLDALTNYTVTIRATNNINLYSDISITVRTGELGK